MKVDEIKVFLRNQYSDNNTAYQTLFDIVFGIIAPLYCLINDPVVFKVGWPGIFCELQNIQVFAYFSVLIGMISLLLWISWKSMPIILLAYITSVLFIGTLLVFILGIVILPIAILGLFINISGILGLVPFVTSVVFLRNGIRALRILKKRITHKAILIMIIGGIISLSIPVVINWKTNEITEVSIYTIRNSQQKEEIEKAIQNIGANAFCLSSCSDKIVRAFIYEDREEIRLLLERAYENLTGKNIYTRWQEIEF